MSVSRHLDLPQFLKHAVKSANTRYSPSKPPLPSRRDVYVLGNPSADLDSIISAIIYSYFATLKHNSDKDRVKADVSRQYIPVINLPDVPSGKELRRLRPEFATALRLAVSGASSSPSDVNEDIESQILKKSILTVNDLSVIVRDAARSDGNGVRAHLDQLDVMMVDWNALPNLPNGRGIHGLSDVYPDLRISVVGCIDHHDDESFVPEASALSPRDIRCIQTGVGSCTSLVVRELRSRGLWPETKEGAAIDEGASAEQASPYDISRAYEAQAAKLALAAILIDTVDMTAESKVSNTDRETVSFLEAKIKDVNDEGAIGWDRTLFYKEIAHAKENSVENLTIEEILGRDYKDWVDTISKETKSSVKIGICNVVKPLSWLLRKISEQEESNYEDVERVLEYLYGHLRSFGADRNLDVIALMTVYSSSDVGFQRELLVYVLNRDFEEAARESEDRAVKEFGLQSWTDELKKSRASDGGDQDGGYRRVWCQTDVSKSRKQVAPLLRKCFSGRL